MRKSEKAVGRDLVTKLEGGEHKYLEKNSPTGQRNRFSSFMNTVYTTGVMEEALETYG